MQSERGRSANLVEAAAACHHDRHASHHGFAGRYPEAFDERGDSDERRALVQAFPLVVGDRSEEVDAVSRRKGGGDRGTLVAARARDLPAKSEASTPGQLERLEQAEVVLARLDRRQRQKVLLVARTESPRVLRWLDPRMDDVDGTSQIGEVVAESALGVGGTQTIAAGRLTRMSLSNVDL